MGRMNWNQYRQLVDEKIADAYYNMEQAEKSYNQAKANYDAAMREKESFETAIREQMGKIDTGKGVLVDVYA